MFICPVRVFTGLTCLCLLVACTTTTRPDDREYNSRFARQTSVPYLTSAPYARWPGNVYPDNPENYFQSRELAIKQAMAGNCAAAAPVLNDLVNQYADDSRLWAELGLCQAVLNQNTAAIRSLKAALELGTTIFDGRFEMLPAELMAKVGFLYAKTGDRDAALTWLNRALAARYANRPFLSQQPDAAVLADDPAFAKLAGLPPAGTLSRDAKWRYDIDFFAEQIRLLHFDPDQHTPAADLEQALQALKDDIPNLGDEEIVIRIWLITGMLGAGHDVLLAGTPDYGAARRFAVRTYLFNDGVYIIEAQDASLLGARIEALGEWPVDDVISRVGETTSRDNNQTAVWKAASLITFPVLLEAVGIVADAATASMTVTDRDGKRRTVRPELAPPASNSPALVKPPGVEAPLYLSRLEQRYWTRYLADEAALYVQVNGLSEAPEGERFQEFTRRLQTEIADPGVRDVILDLRHNIGGNSILADKLLRVLVHFDMEPDKGDLYVIIGRDTFSSAQSLITRLESLSDTVFVGEPSGSRPNFIGRVGQFQLPYSRLFGFLSSELSQESLAEDHRIWTAPQMPVGLTSREFFAGQDPALEAIRVLMSGRGN